MVLSVPIIHFKLLSIAKGDSFEIGTPSSEEWMTKNRSEVLPYSMACRWVCPHCDVIRGTPNIFLAICLEMGWDYSVRKGRDGQKKKIGKADERKGKVKMSKR